MPSRGKSCEIGGWCLHFGPGSRRFPCELRDKLVNHAVAAASGGGGSPRRRSRHAETYQITASDGVERVEAFVKIYDAPTGRGLIKRLIRGSRADHAARVGAALGECGFGVPAVIFNGEERPTGRTMLASECAKGKPLDLSLAESQSGCDEQRHELLRALGAEVARLHCAGYIHGDLTPHNVFVADRLALRFVFIDHDRTRKAFAVGRRRRQLRNLVQLLRFDLPQMTESGRMLVLETWAESMRLRSPRTIMSRGLDMLALRIARDRGKAAAIPKAGRSPTVAVSVDQ